MGLLRYAGVCGALLLGTVPSYASVITFSSRALFNAAAPGLPIETFETGLVAPGIIENCDGPVNSASGSTCFPLAGLLPGSTYSASPGPSLALIGAGYMPVGNANTVLGPTLFVDTFNISFTNATAVGFDVFPAPVDGSVQIAIFDPSNGLLGTFTFAAVHGPNFFGVTSDSDLIGRVNVASQSTIPGELIDNVAFGIPSAAVPEPSSLTLLVGGLALLLRFRRRPS